MSIETGDVLDKLIQDARILSGERMLRDEQPLTEELAKAVIDRFGSYLQRTGKTADFAARSMAISASTLSQIVSGSYAADPEKHLRIIDKWLEQQIMRESAPKPPGFVKIGVAEQIYGVARWVQKTSSIGLIHGPNGCGKTTTLQAIRAETPGSVYISIDSSGRRVRCVLESLVHALRIGAISHTGPQLFRHAAMTLKDTGRLIIVDEIHKLAGRTNDDALHVLRDLHDATACPMLWAGNGKIASYIQKGRADCLDPIEQVAGRISWWLDLTEKAQGGGDDGTRLYTVDDIRKVFAASKIRLMPDAERYLASLANDSSLGCLRAAKHLVSMAVVVTKGQPITAEILRNIQRQRLGRRAAEAVEAQLEQSAAAVA